MFFKPLSVWGFITATIGTAVFLNAFENCDTRIFKIDPFITYIIKTLMSTVEKNSDREPEQNSNFWVPPQTY